jgi:hypothetical protein
MLKHELFLVCLQVNVRKPFDVTPGRQPTGPVSILEYYFVYSYRRFSTCYVDENTTIRSSERISPNS